MLTVIAAVRGELLKLDRAHLNAYIIPLSRCYRTSGAKGPLLIVVPFLCLKSVSMGHALRGNFIICPIQAYSTRIVSPLRMLPPWSTKP